MNVLNSIRNRFSQGMQMSIRSLGNWPLAFGLAVMVVAGQQAADAHEAAAPAAKPELLAGDEQSDAIVTGTASAVASKFCQADNTMLSMPFAEKGSPDEAP
jgi:hypothetical protein